MSSSPSGHAWRVRDQGNACICVACGSKNRNKGARPGPSAHSPRAPKPALRTATGALAAPRPKALDGADRVAQDPMAAPTAGRWRPCHQTVPLGLLIDF